MKVCGVNLNRVENDKNLLYDSANGLCHSEIANAQMSHKINALNKKDFVDSHKTLRKALYRSEMNIPMLIKYWDCTSLCLKIGFELKWWILLDQESRNRNDGLLLMRILFDFNDKSD